MAMIRTKALAFPFHHGCHYSLLCLLHSRSYLPYTLWLIFGLKVFEEVWKQ